MRVGEGDVLVARNQEARDARAAPYFGAGHVAAVPGAKGQVEQRCDRLPRHERIDEGTIGRQFMGRRRCAGQCAQRVPARIAARRLAWRGRPARAARSGKRPGPRPWVDGYGWSCLLRRAPSRDVGTANVVYPV